MATIYAGMGSGSRGQPYPNGGFPMPDANAPEALQARQKALDRASLRAAPAAASPVAAAPPVAPAAAPTPTAKPAGILRRAIDSVRTGAGVVGGTASKVPGAIKAAPGLLEADIAKPIASALRTGAGATKSLVTGPMAKAALPLAVADAANQSYGTSTNEFAQRTGMTRGADDWTGKGADPGAQANFDAVKDVGIRALGTAQNIGNVLTGGLADRVGNLIAGNGFNRSAGNQVGELFGRGSEVGDGAQSPAAQPTAAQPAATPSVYSDARQGPAVPTGPVAPAAPTAPAANPNGTILRTGNSYSGNDIKFGADINDPQGRALDKATGTQSGAAGYGVSTIGSIGVDGYSRQLANLRALGDGGGAAAPGGGLSGIRHEPMAPSGPPKGMSAATWELLQSKQAQQRLLSDNQLAVQRAGNSQALAIAEMNNTTQRRNNDQTTAVSLRGHELDYERGMAPIRFAAQTRDLTSKIMAEAGDPVKAAQMARSMGRTDIAKTIEEGVTTAQEQAGKADALTENKRKEAMVGIQGAFNHLDKDGQPKVSEALEKKAYARLLRSNPQFHQESDPAKRQKMIDDALGDEELMSRFEKPTAGGYGSVLPNVISGNKPMLRQDNIPNDELLARGKVSEPIGGLRNLLSPNTNKGDRFFDPGDGYEAVNMGDLSARALARLEHHRKQAAERLRK